MLVKDIINILDCEIIVAADLEKSIENACASDMMSDVLAYGKEHSVLLAGLMNPQVVRTAEMMDMPCIVFVRGKTPDESIISLAQSKNITLLKTEERLFPACGKLYAHGLTGGDE